MVGKLYDYHAWALLKQASKDMYLVFIPEIKLCNYDYYQNAVKILSSLGLIRVDICGLVM